MTVHKPAIKAVLEYCYVADAVSGNGVGEGDGSVLPKPSTRLELSSDIRHRLDVERR